MTFYNLFVENNLFDVHQPLITKPHHFQIFYSKIYDGQRQEQENPGHLLHPQKGWGRRQGINGHQHYQHLKTLSQDLLYSLLIKF